MGYIKLTREQVTQPFDSAQQRMHGQVQQAVEVHYYCDRCGAWDVVAIEPRPIEEALLGCVKFAVLGLLLGGLVFWPLWILAVGLVLVVLWYQRRYQSRQSDWRRCNRCGYVWDQQAMPDPNPLGFGYDDFMDFEYRGW